MILGYAGTSIVLDVGSEFVLVALVVKAFAVSLGWQLRHIAVRVIWQGHCCALSMVG